ncbi:MAG: hypothetical protein ACK4UO_02310 [Pseudolabrys sp.]
MISDFGGWLWLFIDVALVAALGGALIYGIMRWRQWKRHPVAAEERDRATREAFERRSG